MNAQEPLAGLLIRIPGPQRPRDAQNIAPHNRPEIPRIERIRVRLQQEEFAVDQPDTALP